MLLFYLVVCGVLQLLFQAFSGLGIAVFWTGFAVCVLFSLTSWGAFLREKLKRKGVARKRQAPREGESGTEEEPSAQTPQRAEKPRGAEKKRRANEADEPVYPQFYAVEGHEGYAFAEYADRYELFFRGADGWVYVKTDYKNSSYGEEGRAL